MANLQESIHRVLHENYILYHMGHYNLIIPNRTDEFLSPIHSSMNRYMGQSALDTQVQAIVRNIEAKGGKAVDTMELIEALSQGNLLENILDVTADALNKGIEQAWFASSQNNFSQILQSAYSFSNILATGRARGREVQSFFNEVIKAIQLITGGQIPKQVFTELTKIGKIIGPKSFRFSSVGYDTITPVTKEQADVINKVVSQLYVAASKFEKKGKLSSESLRSSIRDIFAIDFGEQIGKQMLESAMPNLDAEIIKLSQQTLNKNQNIKLTNKTFIKTGTSQKRAGGTGKVDLLNSDALSLSLELNGGVANIEVATNVAVKWYQGNTKGLVPRVELGQMNLGDILNQFAETPRGLAYNIIAHNKHDQLGMQKLRSTLAASFINEWISGSGGLMHSNEIDKTQLLMINGKLYSIISVVKKIVEQIPYADARASSPVRISFRGIGGLDNRWEEAKQGESQYSWNAAERRSRRVQGIINNLAIVGTLNLQT